MLTEQHELNAPVPAVWKLKVQAERWCRKKLQVAATLTFSNHAYLAQPAVDCVHLGTQEHAEAGKYSDGRRVALGMSRAWQFGLSCHGRTPCSPSTAWWKIWRHCQLWWRHWNWARHFTLQRNAIPGRRPNRSLRVFSCSWFNKGIGRS